MDTRRHRVQRWLAGRRIRRWWRGGLVVVLAVAALFGGLDTVDTKVSAFAAGKEFSDGQFALTLSRARLVDTIGGGGRTVAPAQPGRRYLVVLATVRNDGTVPGRLRTELDLRDVPDSRFYGVWRNRDGSAIVTLGPGLTEDLVFTWVVGERAVAPGDVVTLRVWKKLYRQLMVAYGGKEWLDSPTDYGVTELTVKGSP